MNDVMPGKICNPPSSEYTRGTEILRFGKERYGSASSQLLIEQTDLKDRHHNVALSKILRVPAEFPTGLILSSAGCVRRRFA
jgi:hypothetical protein